MKTILVVLLSAVLFPAVLLAGLFFIPWGSAMGSLKVSPNDSVTVSGTAKTQSQNQVARYSAGVMVASDNKDQAVQEVNKKVEEIIQKLVEFGIPRADIKTEYMNVYQVQDSLMEAGRQRLTPGQWQANNSVAITLRDTSKASSLAELLVSTGATNVNGPTFGMDDVAAVQNELMEEALEDAKAKASKLAQASGRSLGKVLTISEAEGSFGGPITMAVRDAAGGGGIPTEPGSETVSKSLTVTFELK